MNWAPHGRTQGLQHIYPHVLWSSHTPFPFPQGEIITSLVWYLPICFSCWLNYYAFLVTFSESSIKNGFLILLNHLIPVQHTQLYLPDFVHLVYCYNVVIDIIIIDFTYRMGELKDEWVSHHLCSLSSLLEHRSKHECRPILLVDTVNSKNLNQ